MPNKPKSHDPIVKESGIVDVVFGEGVTVQKPVNLYGCTIGAGTMIGPFVEIQKGAVIGQHCRIQSHTFICELVSIGDRAFIGHGVKFINDTFRTGGPAKGNRELWGATRIGHDVSIGSNATILPVDICDKAVIGAGAVVTRDIDRPGIYAGNPARLIRPL
jgi:acetyltransferase-like isoleucine patch superfamily enzyme